MPVSNPEISVVASEEPADEAVAEKPKRARRSRKSADAEATVQDAVPDQAETEPVAADENPARPKSRSRKPKAAPPTEAEAIHSAEAIAVAVPDAMPEPAVADAPAPVSDPVPEEPARRPKKELPADEILVSSSAAEGGEEAKPKKGGWWQRGFFGG